MREPSTSETIEKTDGESSLEKENLELKKALLQERPIRLDAQRS